MAAEAGWHLYIVQTAGGSFYTGITTDVARRFAEHEAQGPRTARYLRGRAPLKLVYSRPVGDRSAALKAELATKRLSRAAKLALTGSTA